MRILVTGAAGFIGFHLSRRLLARGNAVTGLDNLNDYYDVSLKEARLEILLRESDPPPSPLPREGEKSEEPREGDEPRAGENIEGPRAGEKGKFEFVRADLADRTAMERVFAGERFDAIVNLAAQAGVRHSLDNPHSYTRANVEGFLNVLEGARRQATRHLVYASTSSVYGINTAIPFREHEAADHQISLYSATKKANESMAHAYAHLFGIPCTGLRFFTVYGPWGRPDMALFKFTRGILAGEAIPVFNRGHMDRDFTYIDDIVEGVVRVLDRPASPDPRWTGADPNPATSSAPWRLYNIGNHARVPLMRYIEALEAVLGMKAKLELLPMQAGDVPSTEADTSALEAAVGFKPSTPVEVGVRRFVEWYRAYYRV
jgi:UDP-glucuronate 4-epimerase